MNSAGRGDWSTSLGTTRARVVSAPARQIGIGRATGDFVTWPQFHTFPERRGRSDRGRSLLDPHKDYLLPTLEIDGCCEVCACLGRSKRVVILAATTLAARYALSPSSS